MASTVSQQSHPCAGSDTDIGQGPSAWLALGQPMFHFQQLQGVIPECRARTRHQAQPGEAKNQTSTEPRADNTSLFCKRPQVQPPTPHAPLSTIRCPSVPSTMGQAPSHHQTCALKFQEWLVMYHWSPLCAHPPKIIQTNYPIPDRVCSNVSHQAPCAPHPRVDSLSLSSLILCHTSSSFKAGHNHSGTCD